MHDKMLILEFELIWVESKIHIILGLILDNVLAFYSPVICLYYFHYY